ncbi:hypothetical protein [Mycobacteroides abscessus]
MTTIAKGSAVELCAHPDCKRDNGKPAHTPDGMCRSCQRRVATALERVVLDWVQLHQLPAPNKGDKMRGAKVKDYGHPAEWASDMLTKIAICLRAAHDNLASTLAEQGHEAPGEDYPSERAAVIAAHTYLSVRIDKLCRQEWAPDIIAEWHGLHSKVRSQLGLTRPRIALPTPCPDCDMRTLTRYIDVQRDWIECGNCQTQIRSEHYPLWTSIVLEELVTEAQGQS